jgi:hypothetical protein
MQYSEFNCLLFLKKEVYIHVASGVLNRTWRDNMTTETNPNPTGAQAQAAAQGAAAQGTGSAGGFVQSGMEGSIKQSSDINTEEALAIVQSLNPKMAEFFSNLIALNAKRTYDQAQSTDLAIQVGDTNQRQVVNNLAVQALQNAVETANMVGKQAVRHSDIAIDRQWNVDEQGYTVAEILRDESFKQAIVAAVAAAAQQK